MSMTQARPPPNTWEQGRARSGLDGMGCERMAAATLEHMCGAGQECMGAIHATSCLPQLLCGADAAPLSDDQPTHPPPPPLLAPPLRRALIAPPAPPPTHTALALVTPGGAVQVKVPGVSYRVSPAGTQVVVADGPPALPSPAPQGLHTVVGPSQVGGGGWGGKGQ
jgi:hypothetical protein